MTKHFKVKKKIRPNKTEEEESIILLNPKPVGTNTYVVKGDTKV